MGVVPSPVSGIDPRVSLATAVHAAPGAYAALVGSGMSSAAGIPTGWRVIQDLIRKIGVAEGVSAQELGDDPEVWWSKIGRQEPRYDTILRELAPTDSARRNLLLRYFDPPPSIGGPVKPTAAHEALAQLCATGRVRVVLTTNFDRMIERALDAAGITPQVISTPAAVKGMVPLVHSPVTVVKLHGDYANLGLRNTPEELGKYPKPWRDLLARVFDEYGLIVIGWSADYDTALADAMTKSPSRRYPMFWTLFNGHISEAGRRLIDQRRATIIDTNGADEFLTDLVERLGRLDAIASRRSRPSPLRGYAFPPQGGVAQGWALSPLLQLRAVASVGPASTETCGVIRPQHRKALLASLSNASLTTRVRNLSGYQAADASSGQEIAPGAPPPAPLFNWEPTPGANQTTENASYRLGGDASRGVSALVTVRFPGLGRGGGSVVFTCDVGLSLARPLRLGEAAMLWRDGLVLTSTVMPSAFVDILPSDADVTQAEVHVLGDTNASLTQNNRTNDVLMRLDMSGLGKPTQSVVQSMGSAARVSGALTERQSAELVVEAIELMALDKGYLDPSQGVNALRYELGLPLG